ncbi:hypothetical protein VHEMI01876 [[Torrubiella] hemipterigena]|uniref:Uncharacterized protein n=1 Tax=[Torrubiella] hemipterigena TaxID=1531966 RepID=A0A0A1SN26_9HYPO|nr:hypothetical protein VHEMI01876 [[Torrubiella] hemipterigena]
MDNKRNYRDKKSNHDDHGTVASTLPDTVKQIAQCLDIATDKDTSKDLVLSLTSASTDKTKVIEFLDIISSRQYDSSLEDLHDFAGVQDQQDWAVHCPKMAKL